jgi:hypothetical protein
MFIGMGVLGVILLGIYKKLRDVIPAKGTVGLAQHYGKEPGYNSYLQKNDY